MDEQPIPTRTAIARIARPRGNRGEVLAELHTDFPDRFDGLEEVWLEYPDGRTERISLEDAWDHGGRKVLKFRGVDSIADAEKLVGAWVQIPDTGVVQLPDGSYFDHDLVGCLVVDPAGGELGTVVEVLRYSGNHQLLVRGGHGDFMVPAREPICRSVSIGERRIVADLPEGLMDLNP